MTDHQLDVRGLSCPLPVLRAKKMLDSLPPGAEVTVLATDPASVADFAQLCHQTGHTLLDSATNGQVFTFRLRRRE